MVHVAVIGYGYWGPNLVRNFFEEQGSQVIAVSDLNPERLRLVERRYPAIRTTTDHKNILNDTTIDAVVIATPVISHFSIAMQALQAGKHVLVEKPITSTSEEARRLIEESDRRKLTLMVDHTFIYSGAVCKIQDLVAKGELGKIYYYDSVRINLGLFNHEVNVMFDLAVHDLSIMDYVLRARPSAVSATGMCHVPGSLENIAYLTIFFPEQLIAHIHVNWLAPLKLRRTLISGSQKMIQYDDLEPSDKVKIYDKGITVNTAENIHKLRVGYRSGDIWIPNLDRTEALTTEIRHFIQCVESGMRPLTDGRAGLRVVQILEAASKSMKNRGVPVDLVGYEDYS